MKKTIKTAAGLIALFYMASATLWAQESGDRNTDSRQVSVQDLRSDFDALYHGLQSAHANLYANRDKAAYDALYTSMRASFSHPLSLFETRVAFQKFAAFGNVAHARIEFPEETYRAFRDAGGQSFPIYLRIVEGRAYVGENYSGNDTIQQGDEILALDGQPMAYWLARTASNISADTDYIAHSLLEFTFPQYLWLELGAVATFELTVKSADGQPRTVQLDATSRAAQAREADSQPASFALSAAAREARMLDAATAYLRPGPFYSVETPDDVWNNRAFVTFIDKAFSGFIKAGAKRLIIDIRDNPGGDNSFSDAMLAWFADRDFRFYKAFMIRSSDEAAASNQARLDASADAAKGVSGLFAKKYAETPRGGMFDFDLPYAKPRQDERFGGDVYVLINRHSYSNAVTVAAMVQDYGFGTIVGEKTSDMATTYGAMENFTLPATGISVGFPKAHIIRPSGETKSDGVTPDWPIRSPVAPAKNDVVLEALLNRLRTEE